MRGLLRNVRDLFYRTQLIAKVVPNLYQSLIYLLLVAGPGGAEPLGGGHAGSLGAVVLLLVRAAQTGQAVQGTYQAPAAVAAVHRTAAADTAAPLRAKAAPVHGARRVDECRRSRFERVSFAYSPGTPVLSDISFSVEERRGDRDRRPLGRGQVDADPAAAAAAAPARGPLPGQRRSRRTASRARTGTGASPTCPRSRACCTRSVADNIRFFRDLDDEAGRTGGAAGADPRGHHRAGPRATRRSSGRAPTPSRAASSSGSASRARSPRDPEVLVLDEPTSALDPHSEALISESLVATQARADTVHHRAPNVDARHVRPRDGDRRRASGGIRHESRPAEGQPVLPACVAARRLARTGATPT